jgi:endo-1,4-beta-xylanase
MKKIRFIPMALLALSAGIYSCEPDPIDIQNQGNFSDMEGPLKSAADFPIGIAIDYTPFMTDATYKNIVATEASSTTFGYHMKHGALVDNEGSIDFTQADALYDAVTASGVAVFGHTLGWHQNQNATYLETVVGGGAGSDPVNLLANGDFEAGSGDNFTNWGKWNGAASITAGTGANEVHGGARSFKATVAANGNAWNVQFASDLFNTTIDTQYKISFWIKSATAGGVMRLSTGSTAQYSPNYNISTEWSLVSWTIPAKDAQTRILFDMGSTANTYYIDDVTVIDAAAGEAPVGDALVEAVSGAMDNFITSTVTHYRGKVKAWDVVNEPMADGASGLRTSANTTVAADATDVFFWSDYLGRDWALKAFQYAKAADPDALLFINDYNLESNSVKIDSLIGYVEELKVKGAQIDGIGTQMHININTSYAGIDEAFQKLAATGLLVRVSELDVRANPLDKSNFSTSTNPYVLAYQAVMYKYVVDSYIKHVPAAQRHGITIWGVSDQDSWYVTVQGKIEAPLLFNTSYEKKPAYSGVLQALKGQ